ncbi:MAG: dihydroorotate dehydrogenase electron transfer subunit [Pseudomonadota bacterium]
MAGEAGAPGSILVEDARIAANEALPGGHYLLRLAAAQIADRALPGQFVHLRCGAELPLRRPLSILRATTRGEVEVLYKAVGQGTRLLASRQAGQTLSVLGPIGRPFELDPARPRVLAIGGGVGMPPMLFLAQTLRRTAFRPLLLLGSEVAFPFQPKPSTLLVDGMPAGAIAALPLAEDWGVPSRLASGQGFPGCFDGHVTQLADAYLATLDAKSLGDTQIAACGPTPMLRAAAAVAARYRLPAQLCLEEHMACGVGGCAGCVVPLATPAGPAMARVCVDGPVFEARAVYPECFAAAAD